ncbi:hypothetical protein J1N35_014020 [Gossypium stocksii]|uniref:Uncharacterized protein n=1 Tax=Gossypium stocksii TaxID=47602 RepID=A0A9D4A8X1_9ROSI|nr:hypothetical protein J1N35_014020 [Gossypium stocksii]
MEAVLESPTDKDDLLEPHCIVVRQSFSIKEKNIYTLAPLKPKDVYKDQLEMMKFCEMVKGKENFEKTKRKETLSDKSLLDGSLLDFKDPLMDFQLHYSTTDEPFYLWERGKLNIDNSPQVLQAKYSRMNLLEEGGNDVSLKAQF